MKDLVGNLDYNLSLKANKVRIDEIEEKMDDFLLTTDFIKMESNINSKVEEKLQEIEKFREQMRVFKDTVFTEVKDSVKKQTQNIRNQVLSQIGKGGLTLGNLTDKTDLQANNGITIKALKEVLSNKVDRDELDNLISSKANIEEIIKCHKGQDLIQVQLTNLIVMMNEIVQLLGLGTQNVESDTVWQHRKKFLNRQLMIVTKYILSFDSKSKEQNS